MKNLIITALLVLMATSCDSSRITVMDTEDGRITTIRKSSQDITKVNDTLVLVEHKSTNSTLFNISIYGKFINKLPQNSNTKTFSKVVRIK